MKPARMWGGEGTRTMTGGPRPLNVAAPAPHYIRPQFASEDWWLEAHQDCLDAPSSIPTGGVKGYSLTASHTVMFASEDRP